MRRIGLRVDVDTFQGLKSGVPALLDLLDERGVRASFFVALGPDRSGLALKNVFRKKGFARRLVRLRGVYGLRTGLYGSFLPSPKVGDSHPELLREVVSREHELGLHGWDHRRWQDHLARMDSSQIEADYRSSFGAYQTIFNRKPEFSGSPGWIADSRSLTVQESLGFQFASDFRGVTPFYPIVDGLILKTLQLPVTLPTLDELIASGREDDFLEMPLNDLDIYCAHAELEGVSRLSPFRDFVERAKHLGFSMLKLSELCEEVMESPGRIPVCRVGEGALPGRAGKVAIQLREVTSKRAND